MQLSKRDKTALFIGSFGIIVFILLQFGIFPLSERGKKLERSLSSQKRTIEEMQTLQTQYRELEKNRASLGRQLENRQQGFSLFSFIERVADQAGIKDNIVYMKPSESGDPNSTLQEVLVEMKLKTVSLEQLVNFLKMAESPENIVSLERVTIQENAKQTSTLDVIMRLMSVREK